ncbi:MAG: HD domain-containing protein [Armatimonadota bacterium]
MDTRLHTQIRTIAADYLARATGCHCFDHTTRVVHNTRILAGSYPDIDRDALETAAWLHDIGRGMESAAGISHAIISAELAEQLLPPLGFSPEKVRLICDAIADHRFSTGRVPTSLEGKLLQDADRLDALGAIGIARTFAEGHDRELYHPDDPFAESRTPDDDRYTLDHFYTKLLTLSRTMHTPEARAWAAAREEYMRGFLQEFADELHLPNS